MDDLNEAKPDPVADAHAALAAAEGQFDAARCTFKLNPTPANRAKVQVALERIDDATDRVIEMLNAVSRG
ncbi:MAG: hypothetical protein ACR2GP_01690 [Burkholderiaceae bacterium]